MNVFYCDACCTKFETEGTRTEWIDRTYGPCARWTAVCPTCGAECGLTETVHVQSGGSDIGGSMDWGGGSGCGPSCGPSCG